MEPSTRPQLKLYNSLTRKKEVFTPQNGQQIKWYSCGPTVYDASHMGHARSYISFDILRRVLKDHFKYHIKYVMNITDIDDKIIKRARQNHLYDVYKSQNQDIEIFLSEVNEAKSLLEKNIATSTDPDKKSMQEKMLNKVVVALELLIAAKVSGQGIEEARHTLLVQSKDVLCEWLDSKLGSSVTENSIFSSLPRYWEEEFHKDMAALNVLPADFITRVSDYVPEIVEFTKKIIDQGLAYEAQGSVYFDVAKFNNSPGHRYAKLVPEAVSNILITIH